MSARQWRDLKQQNLLELNIRISLMPFTSDMRANCFFYLICIFFYLFSQSAGSYLILLMYCEVTMIVRYAGLYNQLIHVHIFLIFSDLKTVSLVDSF